MLNRLKSLNYSEIIRELRDIRTIGLIAFAIIVVLVSYNSVGIIQTNYELQKKIATLTKQVELQELENTNLSLKNEYLNTDHYLELQARKQFSKALPGENVLLVTEEAALNHVKPIKQAADDSTKSGKKSNKPKYQQNFESWMEFFIRRE